MSTTELPTTPEPPATATTPSPPPRKTGALRGLALRLHFYAGLFVGPFLLIAALTGGLYAMAPTIENFVDRDVLFVDSEGPARPLAEQVAAGVAQRPDLTLDAVSPAPTAGETTRVLFTDPALGESLRRSVFIDPVTARPVGEEVVYGSSGALPFRTWVSQVHRHLHLGEPGRLYSELAASWLWLIALAGLVLWVRRVRARRQRNSARWLFAPNLAQGARERRLNWHAVVGMWILPAALVLSATGLTWSTYAGANIDKLRENLAWTTPVVDTALSGATATTHSDHGGHHDAGATTTHTVPTERIRQLDRVQYTAREAGVTGPAEISVPADDSTAFVVKERRLPGVLSADSVSVDGATGAVVDLLPYSDWPLMAKLANWGIQLHMGLMFGLLNQLLLLAAAIGLVTVIVRGYLMWWRRRPTRDAEWFSFGRPPARGALRRSIPLAVPVLVAAAVIGWFAPVFGVGLLAFLVVDIVVGLVRRVRATA
ncbi:PepSY-associated TM helix domain-containing protein [Nocardia sp. NPDC003345]